VFHGKQGELRQRYREGQEDQLGALGLVVVGSVDGKMVDEAIARKARLILERAGIAAED